MGTHPEDDEDDVDVLERRRDELLDDFAGWAGAHAPTADPSDVGVALDWKIGYADGELTTWPVADLAEFALSWCPRKLSLPKGYVPGFLASLGQFFVFLAARGLLEGAGPEELQSWCSRRCRYVERAMADPANFGMAKALMSGVGAAEDLPTGRDELDALARQLNEMGPDEIDDLLGAGDDGDLGLPPMRRPTPGEVAESAATAPILARMDRLAAFCAAPGRTLTAKGNPRVADALALASELDVETVAGPPGTSVRSIDDLPDLEWLLRVALRARVVRRQRGKLVAVAAFSKLDPVERVDRLADACLVEGIDGRYATGAHTVEGALEEESFSLVAALLGARATGDPLDIDDFGAALAEALLGPNEGWEHRFVISSVHDMLERLEECGLVVREDVIPRVDDVGLPTPRGGTAEPTAVGVEVLIRWVEATGATVPERSDPSWGSAVDVLGLVGRIRPEEWQRDTAAWAAARGEAAPTELADALAATEDGTLVHGVMSYLEGALGDEAARVTITRLVGGRWDGLAAMWLAERGDTSHVDADPLRALHGMVDLLAMVLDDEGPHRVGDQLPAASSRGPLEDMWRIDHPRVREVLEVVGRHHPDKALAKAARRSLAKLRSRA